MIRLFYLIFLGLSLFALSNSYSQTKQYVGGHQYNVNLPEYMKKTYGLNTSASIQFKNTVKDVYGFIIHDTKEVLELADLQFTSAKEFYEDFIKDFAKDEEERTVSAPVNSKKNNINYVEADLTFYDRSSNTNIYYYIGIAETKKAFYKLLCWSTLDNKNKFKEDFKNILYSIKD